MVTLTHPSLASPPGWLTQFWVDNKNRNVRANYMNYEHILKVAKKRLKRPTNDGPHAHKSCVRAEMPKHFAQFVPHWAQ